jgi:uncharacterized Zn finger protein
LGAAITAFAERRKKERPDPATDLPRYKDWFTRNDGMFRAQFYDDVKNIHQELSQVHVDDPRLDELIEKHEEYFSARNRISPQEVFDRFMMFHLSIENIEEIGERFRNLATQIPH